MNNPIGYCQCGCEQKTNIISVKEGNRNKNLIPGQPRKFIIGHHRKGQPQNIAENNGMWKGDDVGIDAVHLWVKSRKPKPKLCENCKEKDPYDLSNISGKYKRDILDYRWICRSCHMISDGRMENLHRHKSRWGD